MSIRIKQTLLLLAITLLPVALSAWQTQRQIEQMAGHIAATVGAQEMRKERHYLREKVADIGTSLQLISRSTEDLLARQSRLLLTTLEGPAPASVREVVYSDTLDAPLEDRPSFLTSASDCGAAWKPSANRWPSFGKPAKSTPCWRH